MRKLLLLFLIATLLTFFTTPLWAVQQNAFRMEVLLDGGPVPEYVARGITYVEALKGKDYEIRLTNPLGIRVAVALAVDGLNSIDARHTDGRTAQKWVLDPYQTIIIRGWQVNGGQARRFFFTTEENSYGGWLGRMENLGVITAAFFRERVRYYDDRIERPAPVLPRSGPSAGAGPRQERERAAGESRARSAPEGTGETASKSAPSRADEYAATGIGDYVSHPVTRVHLDLEEHPAAVITLRYEFRPALIALGVLPQPVPVADPLRRREGARGFRDTGFCPNPK